MSLVGDVIMGCRELATDLPPVLPPTAPFSVAAVSSSFPLASATIFFVFTLVNQWGETVASSEVSQFVNGSQAVQITLGSGFSLGNGITARAYYATTTGLEQTYFNIPSLPFTFDTSVAINFQSPPLRNTAYFPDADGQAVGAFAAYRWLNEGLRAAAGYANGGIPDFGGVGTVNGQPLYNVPGYWKKLDSGWYDGYPLYMARKNDVFRKGPVPGTVGGMLVFQASDRLILETWPQPGRTSGQTTVSVFNNPTDTTVTLASAAGFVLGFGLVQIDSEIMEYSSISSNVLGGLTRGMCGTIPVKHAIGAPVTELNLVFSGYRVPSTYAVGNAGATLNLPPAWEDAVKDYMLARFREAEQDGKEAVRLQKQFESKMKAIPTNRIIAGPRQIAANAGRGAEVYPGLGGTFGGVIVR